MADTLEKPAPRGQLRPPKQARSRRTRAKIVAAATATFEDHGYEATTTAQIARRAGVAVGTVYTYFSDKRAILLEIIHDSVEQIADAVVVALEPSRWLDANPHERVREAVGIALRTSLLRPGGWPILWERFFRDDEVRETMERIEGRVRTAIELLLASLAEQGRVRTRDHAAAAQVGIHSVEWIATRLVVREVSEAELEELVHTSSEMIARLVFEDDTQRAE